MKRAVLYARVSSERQKQEQTIESQKAELRRQIKAAGHTLVKEYIDDGHSGAYLDRPALDQLREDIKTDEFEAVYFLCADRIARDAIHQNIIVGEILRHKKKITINGKDYEENPENRFTLQVLGAVAQFERAKIIERTRRGALHHLRSGKLLSSGHLIFGYRYVKKLGDTPAHLVIEPHEADAVRSVFEMFTSGRHGLNAIVRSLEKRCASTALGRSKWHASTVKRLLQNYTYTGTRYFNRYTNERDISGEGKTSKRGKQIVRPREEWIGVSVPALVSKDLFDQAQERLKTLRERYCQPSMHYLLSGLIECGECGKAYCSARRYFKVLRQSGNMSVYHRAQYRCTRRLNDFAHDPSVATPCRNGAISTHILDAKIVELLRGVLLDPEKLRACMEGAAINDTEHGEQEPAWIAAELQQLDVDRRELTRLYATGKMSREQYVGGNRAIDDTLERLTRERGRAMREKQEAVPVISARRLRQFCSLAKSRFETCADFDAKQKFLREYVERIVYTKGRVTIIGAIPVQGETQARAASFRIVGQIDRSKVRLKASRLAWRDERTTSWVPESAAV